MNKKELTQEQLDKAAQLLKAMAHPVRVAIMALIDGEKMNVTQIYETLNIEQSVASHHLGILRDRGVLVGEREGKNVYYSYKSDLLLSVIECVTIC